MDEITLGVVIPCRNEAAVIERKLANLARCRFPDSSRPHRVAVVDDNSEDETALLGYTAIERHFGRTERVRAALVPNDVRNGKPGAIRAGMRAVGESVDVIVLTDAHVVLAPRALDAIAEAFRLDPHLAMVTGARHLVRSLAADGSLHSADGGELDPQPSTFETWLTRARRIESRAGRVFAVHGQLLAWRAALDIQPSFGVAAAHLDLMLRVRARSEPPRTIERLDDAEFHEVRLPAGAARDAQALRRARAWVQAVRRAEPPRSGALDRVQWFLYRYAPTWTPLATLLPVVFALALAAARGWLALAIAAAVCALVAWSPLGRRWLRLCRVMLRAWIEESRHESPERWERIRA